MARLSRDKAEGMTAVAATKLCVTIAARHELYEMPGVETEERVFEQSITLGRSEETVTAMTCILDQPVPPCHFMRAMPE